MAKKVISVMIPTYNEEENARPIYEAVRDELQKSLPQYDYEILFIDNKSQDRTREIIREICARDKHVKAIFNCKNFGQFNSPYYGMIHTSGDCTVTICADFQDPVEMIPKFVAEWEKGYKIVIGKKTKSQENGLVYFLRGCYYKTIRKMSSVEMIEQFTGFGLYDRSFIQTLLETNGYQALVAQTCVMGMTMFISYNPDLVILDLGLPDRDGLDAIRSIRQKYLTPIIVLSARTTERDKIEALDLGANDYITKPFGTGELLARVRAALRVNRYGGGSLPGGVFSAQGLTINYERRKVFVDGQEVRLTQTEYNIVAFLSEHAGRVMTYAAIVRAIWGDTDASSTKKLQVNMANIRKKLGSRPGSNTYILNELGVGYRMIEEDAKPLEPAEETK